MGSSGVNGWDGKHDEKFEDEDFVDPMKMIKHQEDEDDFVDPMKMIKHQEDEDDAADPAMTAAFVKEATEAAAIASNTAHKEVITAEDAAIQAKAKQLAAEENIPTKVLKPMQREPKLAAKNKIKKVHRHHKTVGGRREPKHFGGD